jgi:hypothetical protein
MWWRAGDAAGAELEGAASGVEDAEPPAEGAAEPIADGGLWPGDEGGPAWMGPGDVVVDEADEEEPGRLHGPLLWHAGGAT